MTKYQTTRRALVAGAAISSAAVIAPTIAGASTLSAPAAAESSSWPNAAGVDARLFELWQRRRDVAAAAQAASATAEAAVARMPAWARSGPQYVDGAGAPADDCTVGWPAIEAAPRARAGRYFLVRPSPSTIEDDFKFNLRSFGDERAQEIRDEALAALRKRRRQQAAEERKVNLRALDRTAEALYERKFVIEAEIQALTPCTPNLVAALALIEICYECGVDETTESPHDGALTAGVRILSALRSHLYGPIGAGVGELLDNPSMPIGKMALAGTSI